MAYQSFEDLEVWQRACRIAAKTFEVLKSCRDYGLRDQMTRSAVSIASNIAEGAERDSLPEFVRFLNIAKGSAAELRTQVYIAGSATDPGKNPAGDGRRIEVCLCNAPRAHQIDQRKKRMTSA